ncbi:acetyl-CoA carboxylase biotin carboxyl carrier protein subunit, partial [Actinotignum timonense]|nr:acetyl-CoA carboxylase biotin carboxyl carrier protein subunit [Actinotignum timonense]
MVPVEGTMPVAGSSQVIRNSKEWARVVVEPGDKVHEGDLLVVLESMKMESYVYSPRDGEVTDVEVRAGATVAAFQPLVRVVGADA